MRGNGKEMDVGLQRPYVVDRDVKTNERYQVEQKGLWFKV